MGEYPNVDIQGIVCVVSKRSMYTREGARTTIYERRCTLQNGLLRGLHGCVARGIARPGSVMSIVLEKLIAAHSRIRL